MFRSHFFSTLCNYIEANQWLMMWGRYHQKDTSKGHLTYLCLYLARISQILHSTSESDVLTGAIIPAYPGQAKGMFTIPELDPLLKDPRWYLRKLHHSDIFCHLSLDPLLKDRLHTMTFTLHGHCPGVPVFFATFCQSPPYFHFEQAFFLTLISQGQPRGSLARATQISVYQVNGQVDSFGVFYCHRKTNMFLVYAHHPRTTKRFLDLFEKKAQPSSEGSIWVPLLPALALCHLFTNRERDENSDI